MLNTDWKVGPYLGRNPKRGNLITIDTDFVAESFTLTAFSLSVSSLWDWDLPVSHVDMSRYIALQVWQQTKAVFGKAERYSLEQLVWEGWELPATWLRCGGVDSPGWMLGATPVRTVLRPGPDFDGFSWVVHGKYPEKDPAYQRVLNYGDSLAEMDSHLDTILSEKLKFEG